MSNHTLARMDTTSHGPCTIVASVYNDGSPALKILDKEERLVAYLSINIPYETHKLAEDEYFIRDFSENETLAREAMGTGIFKDTGKTLLWNKQRDARIWRLCKHKP